MKNIFVAWFYVALVFSIIGCGGGTVKKPQIFDSPIITQSDIDKALSSNQTVLKKSILADDGKTVINFSLDLRENNITENIPLSAKIEHFDQDGLYADLVTVDFGGKALSNFEINIPSSKLNRSVKSSKESRDTLTSFQKSCEEMLIDAPTTYSYSAYSVKQVKNTNICEYITGIELKYNTNDNKYNLIINQIKNFPKARYSADNEGFRVSQYSSKWATRLGHDNKKLSLLEVAMPSNIILNLNIIDSQYKITIGYFTSGAAFFPFLSFFVTTDLLGKDNNILVASKTLKNTRANKAYDNSSNSFNNFFDSQELKQPMPLYSTITHRIVDFDKVLSKKLSPNNFWNTSKYGKNPLMDNGRIPLLLIHGWQGGAKKDHRDATRLLLWEHNELEYWHNFLSYYLSSKELQSKYHVYLYKYTSYKHVTYNAKKLKELLFEVRTRGAMSLAPSDLEEGLNNTGKGITILAHSMGGLVSRSLIEEHNYFGENLDGLNKLITLDTPHHGSVTAENFYPQSMAKDLSTQGAADLNWDNFDGSYDDNLIGKINKKRWAIDSINSNSFDDEYKERIKNLLGNEIVKTSNPYLFYLNKKFSKNKIRYVDKYIFYTAWNVHNIISIKDPLGLANFMNIAYECGWGKFGVNLGTKWTMKHQANQNFKYNFIDNDCQDISTMAMGNNPSYSKGYAAGGAAPVGSSLLSNQHYNPKVNDKLEGYNKEGINIPVAIDGVPLIKVSDGIDHAYGIPYRIFWDYDHTSIFSGASNGEKGVWDKYIVGYEYGNDGDTSNDTYFREHRAYYIRSAFKIRNGKNLPYIVPDEDLQTKFNPLTNEPVFLVIEKDLMDSAIDEETQNTISGQINAANGTPIPYINVKFEYIQNGENQEITVISDSDGKYSISIDKEDFDNFKNGTKLIIYAYGDGYAPAIREIEKTDQTSFYENFVMEVIKENEIVLEIEPKLHHLGDGNYGGTVNSDFQRVSAEGTEFVKTFYIDTNKYNLYQRAEITFEAKGVQAYGTKLYLNDASHTLQNSPTNGSYATQKFSIDKSEYIEGYNEIKIVSGKGSDFDDFEFINIKIIFLDSINQIYRDNVNEIVIDPMNNLVWQDNTSIKTNVNTVLGGELDCIFSGVAGYSWRLPTTYQISTLIRQHAPYIDANFQNIASGKYWTSSSNENQESTYWLYDTATSILSYENEDIKHHIMCVSDRAIQ